ncbi:somatostatin receptor type 5-like [Gigantopelta aegis]|uniref:somatostatin receptor type 5-like n=1 Tax=Gigantopelta aegis TaxID=1735272 RepID=UPI001B88C6B8|nr:somatostatin receptor type 5-like [Gigantopelta aegis]XP_041355565.1 somatostatin receptor type 5-like [Gigantopelta aegis]
MSDITAMISEEDAGMFDVTTHMDTLLKATDSSTKFNVSWIYVESPGYAYWVCNVLTVVVGLVGNCLVSVLMTDAKFSVLSYSVYLRFLAVSDSVVLIFFCIKESMRLFTSPYLVGSNFELCALTKFTRCTVTTLSPWLVVGLTVDRFYCVVFPLKRDRFCTRKKATVVCSCLTVLSIILSVPILFGVKLLKEYNVCFIQDSLLPYFAVNRLILNSNLPCLLILVFNIVIGIHIQRSTSFRKRFTSASSGSRENKLDKSLLPLMLISILAFATVLPPSIVDSIISILIASKSYFNTLALLIEWWPVFNILYLVNFGQNFYILIASSANYRTIMKTKMGCSTVSRPNYNTTVSMVAVQTSNPSDMRTNIIEFSTIQLSPARLTAVTSLAVDSDNISTDVSEISN